MNFDVEALGPSSDFSQFHLKGPFVSFFEEFPTLTFFGGFRNGGNLKMMVIVIF